MIRVSLGSESVKYSDKFIDLTPTCNGDQVFEVTPNFPNFEEKRFNSYQLENNLNTE